jgi:hypothetical protein
MTLGTDRTQVGNRKVVFAADDRGKLETQGVIYFGWSMATTNDETFWNTGEEIAKARAAGTDNQKRPFLPSKLRKKFEGFVKSVMDSNKGRHAEYLLV